MMRIITGRARGTHLYTLEGMSTRPTTERAKEAIFSALQFELQGRLVLDLFAGSGQLGLEAVSRGSTRAVLVDVSQEATGIIRKNVAKTHFETDTQVVCMAWDAFLREEKSGIPEAFSLVFLDPPYASHLVAPALEMLCCNDWLLPGAIVVCESGEEDPLQGHPDVAGRFSLRKTGKYGAVHMTILELRDGSTEGR